MSRDSRIVHSRLHALREHLEAHNTAIEDAAASLHAERETQWAQPIEERLKPADVAADIQVIPDAAPPADPAETHNPVEG